MNATEIGLGRAEMLLKYYIGVGLPAMLQVGHADSDSKNFDPNPVF